MAWKPPAAFRVVYQHARGIGGVFKAYLCMVVLVFLIHIGRNSHEILVLYIAAGGQVAVKVSGNNRIRFRRGGDEFHFLDHSKVSPLFILSFYRFKCNTFGVVFL